MTVTQQEELNLLLYLDGKKKDSAISVKNSSLKPEKQTADNSKICSTFFSVNEKLFVHLTFSFTLRSGCALLINQIHCPRFFFLIGQVEPLPHSGASDATSSRILHVRLFLCLTESLAVGQKERVPDGSGALDTKHFPSREKRGAHE